MEREIILRSPLGETQGENPAPNCESLETPHFVLFLRDLRELRRSFVCISHSEYLLLIDFLFEKECIQVIDSE